MDSQVQDIKDKLSITDVVGQYVQLQMTTSATYNAALTTTLSIGYTPITDVWSLTVMPPKWEP